MTVTEITEKAETALERDQERIRRDRRMARARRAARREMSR